MREFLNRKAAGFCLAALGFALPLLPALAQAQNTMSDKQQLKFSELLSSSKAIGWLNDGMSRKNGVPSQVTGLEVISFSFKKSSMSDHLVQSLFPVPADKPGLITAYASLTLANGQHDNGIIFVDDPGEKAPVQAYWLSATVISNAMRKADELKSGGKPLPSFRGPARFDDPDVQNCVVQSFLLRPVGDEDYPYQRWVRCTDPHVRLQILTPKSLLPPAS